MTTADTTALNVSPRDRSVLVARLTSPKLAWSAGRAALLSLLLFLVLRPETVGLTPNSLDPFFYSGYAINLDDAVKVLGQRWYFVTRWTSYLPNHALTTWFGPFAGRLVWRWILATASLVAVWRVGRRWRWNLAQELLVGTVLVTMPLFLRSLFTDYVDHAVVGFGVLLVCFALKFRHAWWSLIAIGVLSAAMLIANPASLPVVAASVGVALWFGVATWRGRLAAVGIIGGAALAVGLFGLLWFRWQYGLPNIYSPTLEFFRSSRSGDSALKSIHIDWLVRFTWLYAPPLLGCAYLSVVRVRRSSLDRTERVVLALCAVQYVVQWADQFARDGVSLESSFYWAYIYPSFGLLVCMALGRASRGVRPGFVVLATVAWIAALLIGVPESLRLPAGALFFVLAVSALAAGIALAVRSGPAAALLIGVFVLWMHVGAPPYVPQRGDATIYLSPLYDRIVGNRGSGSDRLYESAVWFEQELDRVPDDHLAFFVPMSAEPWNAIGVYVPHVAQRVLWAPSGAQSNLGSALRLRGAGDPLIIVVLGDPADVAREVEALGAFDGVGTPLLDETERGGRGFRLAVYRWAADSLPPSP